MLVIRVPEDGQVPFRVVKEMHRSNAWASEWLKRYDKEGIEGLKTKQKSGRPSRIITRGHMQDQERTIYIQSGLDHKTGGRVNCKGKRYQISLYSHIPYTSKMGL